MPDLPLLICWICRSQRAEFAIKRVLRRKQARPALASTGISVRRKALRNCRRYAHFAKQMIAAVDGIEQPVDVANVGVNAAGELRLKQPI
jgi:hypothetical protein